MKLKFKVFDTEEKLNDFLSKNAEYKLKKSTNSHEADKLIQVGGILVESVSETLKPICKSSTEKLNLSDNLLFILKYFELDANEKKEAKKTLLRFPNNDNNAWLCKYNSLIAKSENAIMHKGMTFHHILPRCTYPEETNDPANHSWLSFKDHFYAHYCLWKGTEDPQYAMAFWFICMYGLKNKHCHLSKRDMQKLKKDILKYRRMKA